MTVVLVAAYWLARAVRTPDGAVLQLWNWAVVNTPIAETTADFDVLAICANLVMGLIPAAVSARFIESRLSGPAWWRGVRFSPVP